MGLCAFFPFSGQVFYLAWTCTNLVSTIQTPWVHISYIPGRYCFMNHLPPLSLTVFPHPLQYRSLSFDFKDLIKRSHLGLSVPKLYYTLYIAWLWIFVLIKIDFKKKTSLMWVEWGTDLLDIQYVISCHFITH